MRRAILGFTLVEMIVAVVIFSLIMLAAVSALKMTGVTFTRLNEFSAEVGRNREVERFLRSALTAAIAKEDHFSGDSASVEWVAPLDRVGSAGGFQHLRLYWSGGGLYVSFAPYDLAADIKTPEWGAVLEDYLLLSGVDTFDISYAQVPGGAWETSPQNQSSGDQPKQLPAAIRLNLAVNDRLWPPLIVAFDAWEVGL